MRRAPFIALGFTLAAALWLASGQNGDLATNDGAIIDDAPSDGGQPPVQAKFVPRVQVMTSTAKTKIREITLYGRTEADRTVEVSAETAGRIISMDLVEGKVVRAGDVLAHLSQDDRKARLDDAQAQVKYHELLYEAARKLSQKKFTSEVKLAEDYAALETARAALAVTELDIARTRITAPFSGVLEKLLREVGDYVRVGDVIGHVVDLNPVVVAADVTEREIDRIKMGTKASVTLLSGERREGKVGFISRRAHNDTRTFRIEVELDNRGYTIPEGMTVEVAIMTSPVTAHFVSPAILTLNNEGDLGVKTVDDRDRVVFYPVKIVSDTPKGIWISGLPDQTVFISVGQEFVKVGQIVESVRSQ